MVCIIFGCGRSGTNLTLEILRGHSYFTLTDVIEDKELFIRDSILKSKVLTKCDTIYCRSYIFFKRVMETTPYVRILFTIRHPWDICLSKMYRGRDGADDASFEGCVSDMFHMFALYKRAIAEYKDRIHLVRMEDTILDIEKQAKTICKWLGLEFEEAMTTPHERMRHPGKKERYSLIDKSQIGLWKHWEDIYDGFFTKQNIPIEDLFKMMEPICIHFGYELK